MTFATSSMRTLSVNSVFTKPATEDGWKQSAAAICGPHVPGGAMPVGVAVAITVFVGVGVIVGVFVTVPVGKGVPLLMATVTAPFV